MTILATRTTVLAVAALFAAGLAGCAKTDTATDKKAEKKADAAAVSISDQWIKAAPSGMTGMFGTLTNSGDAEATVISATSPAAARVELHEVVGDPGSTTMRPKEGGFAIPAGGTHVLAPGADHVMLMDLVSPLAVGTEVEVTLTLDDGSTVPVTAQVRDFSGAAENYQPAGPASTQPSTEPSEQHSGHSGGHG